MKAFKNFITNLLGWNKPTKTKIILTCIRQDETWCWPPHLGEKTEGVCMHCGSPIYFEKQNAVFENKICNRCR